MKHTTFLILAMIIFILSLPFSFYLASIGFLALGFTIFLIVGMALIIGLYYPLFTILK